MLAQYMRTIINKGGVKVQGSKAAGVVCHVSSDWKRESKVRHGVQLQKEGKVNEKDFKPQTLLHNSVVGMLISVQDSYMSTYTM